MRELYARLVAAHEALWATRDRPTDPTPDELLDRIADGAALSRRYAFLAREVLSLLHADPVLAAAYTTVRAQRVALFTALARGWRDQGVIRPLGDREVADLVQAVWIISETWLAFSGLDGTCVDADDGARLLRTVLRPHLTRDHSAAGRIATTSAAVPP